MKKYITLVQSYIIQKTIKPELEKAKCLGLSHDGWTEGSEHYLALYATFMKPDVHKVDRVTLRLLSCSVQEDIDEHTHFDEDLEDDEKFFGFTAADLFDMVMLCLHDEYDLKLPDAEGNRTIALTADNLTEFVAFFAADNCNVNKALADRAGIPLSGCNSHRLHLGVEEFIGPVQKKTRAGVITQEESELRSIIYKVDRLMGELKTLKNSAMLRVKSMELTGKDLKPQRMNTTRWSSKFSLCKKEQALRPVIDAVRNWPQAARLLIPTDYEREHLDACCEALALFESVSKALQCGGNERKNLAQCRILFDGLIDTFERYPDARFRSRLNHIRPGATIVNNPHFENGLVKIQEGREGSLSRFEKEAVKAFKKKNHVADADSDAEGEVLGYADKLLLNKRKRESAYECTNHVLAEANCCERTFSRARLYMSHLRAHMDPSSLEQLLFLFFNKELWENPNIIDKAIAWEKDEKLKVAAAASAAAAAVAATAAAAVAAMAEGVDENEN